MRCSTEGINFQTWPAAVDREFGKRRGAPWFRDRVHSRPARYQRHLHQREEATPVRSCVCVYRTGGYPFDAQEESVKRLLSSAGWKKGKRQREKGAVRARFAVVFMYKPERKKQRIKLKHRIVSAKRLIKINVNN